MEFLILLIAPSIFLFWQSYCNKKTYDSQDKLIHAIIEEPDYKTLMKLFQAVSYGAEVNSRMLFRDWRKLYPAPIRERFPHFFS